MATHMPLRYVAFLSATHMPISASSIRILLGYIGKFKNSFCHFKLFSAEALQKKEGIYFLRA